MKHRIIIPISIDNRGFNEQLERAAQSIKSGQPLYSIIEELELEYFVLDEGIEGGIESDVQRSIARYANLKRYHLSPSR